MASDQGKGSGQRGRARAPKVTPLTPAQKRRANQAGGAATPTVRRGIKVWPKKDRDK